MRPLTANEFLLAREMDETHDAADRAVAVLSFAYPEETAEDLRHRRGPHQPTHVGQGVPQVRVLPLEPISERVPALLAVLEQPLLL